MTSKMKNNATDLRIWLDDLLQDHILAQVVETLPFRRLASISFLGAIDYTCRWSHVRTAERSRSAHSLGVAALANFISSQRGYSSEKRRHVIIAALLHDVGHAPLSHSVEPYFKEKLGVGHHELGRGWLYGRLPGSAELSGLLAKSVDRPLVTALIEGQAEENYGGDLFASRINIDTIDGILRSYNILAGSPFRLDPLALARASFLREDDKRFELLDSFWTLKHKVYNQYITGKSGLEADFYSQKYFSTIETDLEESHLVEREECWESRYPALFEGLYGIGKGNAEVCRWRKKPIPYVQREYTINSNNEGMARYQVEKRNAVFH